MPHRQNNESGVQEKGPTIKMEINGLRWYHIIGMFSVLTGGGLYSFHKLSDGTTDVAGRVEGAHTDTIRHLDARLKPIEDRLTKVESWEDKAQQLAVQMARLSQKLDDFSGHQAVLNRPRSENEVLVADKPNS